MTSAPPPLNSTRLTRRRFLWFGGLMAPLTVLGGAFALRSLWGPRAQRFSAALTEVPAHAPVLLLLACRELEEGNLQNAREAIAQLRAAAPEHPEPKLLELLLEHRQHALASSWGQAFLDAWVELGRPDFQHSSLLPAADVLVPDDPAAEAATWRRAPSPTRLALALSTPDLSEERARWLLQQVPVIENPSLVIAACDALAPKSLPASLHQEALPLLRQRLAGLTDTASRVMQLPLLMLLVGTEADAPFSARELEALDAISLLPAWKDTTFSRTFLEARQLLQEVGVPQPVERAFLLAERATGSDGALLLFRRAEASAPSSEDARRWMGRMLWRIGSRLAECTSYLEHSVGLLLMDFGAEDMNHSCGQSEAYTRQNELSASVVASLRVALERWPLPSLLEELAESRARHEISWLRAWLDKPLLP